MMDQMKSKDRAYLRSEAQTLSPVVYVGKNGLTDSVVAALDEALDAHELVKVRFQAAKDETRPISETLAEKTASTLVATTGFTAVFYRRNPDPEKRKYYF